MNCNEFENIVVFLAENEISETEKTAAETHIQSCNACRNLYANVKESFMLLNSEKVSEIDLNFTDNVMKIIYVNELSGKRFSRKIISILRPAAIAASIALVAALGIFSGNIIAEQNSDNSSSEIFYMNDFEQENIEYHLLNE